MHLVTGKRGSLTMVTFAKGSLADTGSYTAKRIIRAAHGAL